MFSDKGGRDWRWVFLGRWWVGGGGCGRGKREEDFL